MHKFKLQSTLKSVIFFAVLGVTSLPLAAHAQNAQIAPLQDLVLPAPIEAVLFAQPFKLETGYRVSWRQDAPPVSFGTIVVLKADPNLTVPRQSASPVLYAGDSIVHTLNSGHSGEGVVIGLVPGVERLSEAAVWYGQPRQPDMIDEKTIELDRTAAFDAGIKPLSVNDFERVAREETVTAPNLAALLRDVVAELVLEFAPKERSLAEKWRLPEVGYKTPKKDR